MDTSHRLDDPSVDVPAYLQASKWDLSEIDALLVLSFGGPEGPDDIRPFLENVTRGRGIPPERLDEVGAHYHHFGGVSPLNALNRALVNDLRDEVSRRGLDLPVYLGNRNWKPFAKDVIKEIAADGHRKVAVFATSAWGGYSGCKQYDEDIESLRQELREQGLQDIEFLKLRQFFNHPTFVELNAQAIQRAFEELTAQQRQDARLVFTAHSIPVVADRASGTKKDGALYSSQVREAARLVAERLSIKDYDVVWQSASGDGKIPWLEPDICDHAQALHEAHQDVLVVCSIGFISDHMEVVWDLDHELQNLAEEQGMRIVRADTIGAHPEFAGLVLDLLEESLEPLKAQHLGTVVAKGCTVNGQGCEVGCCEMPKRPHHRK